MRPDKDVGEAAFIEANPDFNKNAVPGDIIVADDNFGCGSSREYAPQSLRRREVGAIIANSFARIFFRNAINLGIPLYVAPELTPLLSNGDEVELDIANSTLTVDGQVHPLPPLPQFAQEIMAAGGIVSYVRENGRFPAS